MFMHLRVRRVNVNRSFVAVGISILIIAESCSAYYSYSLGRWCSRDPIGYVDGMSLYEYIRSRPIKNHDTYGLSGDCPPPPEWDTSGSNNGWSALDAWLHYRLRMGTNVEFNAKSVFSQWVRDHIRGLDTFLIPELKNRAESKAGEVPSGRSSIGFFGQLTHYAYYSDDDLFNGTLGSGGENNYDLPPDPTSAVKYNACCCISKSKCQNGKAYASVGCKVEVVIWDLYGFFYNPDMDKGKNFWTIVHCFKDLQENVSVPCK
jgi:hypothetical protein